MSQQGIYNELKTAWWFARDGAKLPDAPKQVQLILSDLCNQDCSFCAYRMSGYTSNELFMGGSEAAKYGHNNPRRWIETARARKLLDEFKELGVLGVQFTGGGEPTVHPDHEALFERALELGLRCSLVSNGVKWSSPMIRAVLPDFDWVRVSIDAGGEAEYAAIRNTPAQYWHRVWSNVRALAAAIKERKGRCVLGVGFVVTPDNWKQIPDFMAQAAASGAHNARLTAMFSPDNEKPFVSAYPEIKTLIAKTRAIFQTAAFAIYDNFGSRFEDLVQHAPDYKFCSYQYYTAYVGGDLNAYRCCLLAYNKRGQMPGGNLKDRSFVDFWNSPERKADMENLDARGCERCQFSTKNRNWLAIAGDLPHKEWP